MKDDHGGPGCIVRKRLGFFTVEQDLAFGLCDRRTLFAFQVIFGNDGFDGARFFADSKHFPSLFGPEALARRNVVESLEKARLSLSVGAADDVDARRRSEIERSDVAKVPYGY